MSMSLTVIHEFRSSCEVSGKALEQLCDDPCYEYEVTQIASSADLSPINTSIKSIISS